MPLVTLSKNFSHHLLNSKPLYKMKTQSIKFIALTISFFFTFYCNGQDIITLKNGDEIKSKLTEVEDAAIKYKKFENLTGPTYSLPKGEVFMIQYENGSKEVYNTPEAISQQNTSAQKPIQQSTQNTIGSSKYRKEIVGGAVMTGLGIPCLVVGASLTAVGGIISATVTDYRDYDGSDLWISGACLLGVGTVLTIAGPIQLSKGIKHRKAYKSGRAFIDFAPINNKCFDTHFHTFNPSKLGSLTLNF